MIMITGHPQIAQAPVTHMLLNQNTASPLPPQYMRNDSVPQFNQPGQQMMMMQGQQQQMQGEMHVYFDVL
jgi:hypothetical protein